MPNNSPIVTQTALPGKVAPEDDDLSGLIGRPDGPKKFIPEFGFEVGTFTDPRVDLYKIKDPGKTSLMHHVPIAKRGYYKPEATADYDPEEYDYICDDMGYALCTAKNNQGKPCQRKAMNMSWACTVHGGKLHPLDKVLNDDRNAMQTTKGGYGLAAKPEIIDQMTRYQKLCQGIISVDELDDEELARGQCRGKDGRFANVPPRMIPKSVHDRMVNELFKRADEKLKHSLLDVVDTMTDIAKGDAYEPADRIKAATWVFERVRGKNPEVVVHTQDKPWELALSAISGGSRAESREARGLDPETGESLQIESPQAKRERLLRELAELDGDTIDAEVVDEPATSPNWERDPSECDWELSPDEGDGNPLGQESDYGDGDGDQSVHDDEDATVDGESEAEPDESEDRVIHGVDAEEDEGWSNKPGEAGAYGRKSSPDEVVKAKQELEERLKAGRRQRGFARKNGLSTVKQTPYQLIKLGKHEDGKGYLVGFKLQSTPSKKRGNDDYRHRI